MKILSVVGARPQFIKASAISREIKLNHPDISEIMVHTGQHYDANMSDIFFNELDIPQPQYNLGINQSSHAELTGRILTSLEPIFYKELPDWVLVYGDTDSTLAAALAAAKMHLKVAHVEAGLRSYNKRMPEEINRLLTDHLASVNFCPTCSAVDNLGKEGFNNWLNEGRLLGKGLNTDCLPVKVDSDKPLIVNVGDVMYDVLLFFKEIARQKSEIDITLGIKNKQYAIATIHREENTNLIDNLLFLMDAIITFAHHLPVIMPVHPRTEKILRQYGQWGKLNGNANIKMLSPLPYLDMVRLVDGAQTVITDSGGLQKEAFFMGVPCLTVRDETEWNETVLAGMNLVVGQRPIDLWASFRQIISLNKDAVPVSSYFGDGYAASKIVKILHGLTNHYGNIGNC